MNIFNVISLCGGLAMFLYGMRMMGDGLKESSSEALKNVMEKVTGTPLKAFFLGLLMTAVIQSSKATIVITSGLVGAGIISLHQSLGIIIGANVGTTVTGQMIRLLDVKSSGTSVLQFFKPDTLAPLALVIGIVMIMSKKGPENVGKIIIGFGILFSGLLGMTDAVSVLTEGDFIQSLFPKLGENPFIGGLIGGGVAFVLQSASASIGILQAFSTSGQLTFSAIYAVLIGIYIGDCITTAIVCNIGAKPDARRVGIFNIIYNIEKMILILVAVGVAHKLGFLDKIWDSPINSGGIANANTIFNLGVAVVLLPFVSPVEKLSMKIIKDEPASENENKYKEKLDALNPVFFSTSAIAFARCYDVLVVMYELAKTNINRAFDLLEKYDADSMEKLEKDEDDLDMLTDKVSNYLVQISAHIVGDEHVKIMNHYHALITEFERLGDHATNIAEVAQAMNKEGRQFSENALGELSVLREIINTILDHSEDAFKNTDVNAAHHIEPLEEVVDDMVNVLKQNHLERLREKKCHIFAGTQFLNLLSDIERISDVCSNIGVATVERTFEGQSIEVHEYVSKLHAGTDETFNKEYNHAHEHYFTKLKSTLAEV